jgi:NTE family protein
MRAKRGTINLALQGGGAHGAFTWGVLDRLLSEPGIDFGWISATSAGAVNAVALAAGLAEGGREGARAKLKAVWEAVAKANEPDFLKYNPLMAGMSKSGALSQVVQMFSPYDLNPLGIDPLRKLIEAHIDFGLLRTAKGPELLIAATHVASGTPRLFRRGELSIEAVLASACLPTLQHAVEIEGTAYWDGGFSANPDLVTLAAESPVEDTLIVQLVPLYRGQKPTSAREIGGHISHLTFNHPFVRELELIETVRRLGARRRWIFGSALEARDVRIAAHRFHLIEAGRFTGGLTVESRGKPEAELLTYLQGAGVTEAGKWLERTWSQVGVRDTAEISRRLEANRAAAVPGQVPREADAVA